MEKSGVLDRRPTQGKGKEFRFHSPELKLAGESNLSQVYSTVLRNKIDLSFERTLQFSPIRYVRSPDFRIPERLAKKPGLCLGKKLMASASQSKVVKNLSQRALSPSKTTTLLKYLTPKGLASRKPSKTVKITLSEVQLWKRVINGSNGIDVNPGPFPVYSVFVGKGNNSSLVKKTILKRNWWVLTEDKDKANFVWTQWKDKTYLASLPSLKAKPHELQSPPEALPTDIPPDLKLITGSQSFCTLKPEKFSPGSLKMHNKLEFNNFISNKKSLYLTLKAYYGTTQTDIFSVVPLTFQITHKTQDPEFQNFSNKFQEFEQYKLLHPKFQNIWIVKPGENSNRGQGISVCKAFEEVYRLVENSETCLIVQKYIESPLLISGRKFDIRCYSLMTCVNGVSQGYFYLDGYLRTASQEFSVKDTGNLFVHLTNDAIQKNSKEYGRYENGNKLSYRDFQKYLERRFPEKKPSFFKDVLPGIKKIVKDTMVASYDKLDPNKRAHCMEIFGYDFMLDRSLKPWLIEVNTNPCLELSSQYLSTLIPAMLQNAFHITLDSLFPHPSSDHLHHLSENRFELIFHELPDNPSTYK